MVLRGAFSRAAIGLAIGIPRSDRRRQADDAAIVQRKTWDPVMLASATLALGLAALLASALPAWRASRLDIVQAMRAR